MTNSLIRKNYEIAHIHNSSHPLIKWCWYTFGIPELDAVIRCDQTRLGWYYENFYKNQTIGTKIQFWQSRNDLVKFNLTWAEYL